jgi:probable F420-dependent oxidoreductase
VRGRDHAIAGLCAVEALMHPFRFGLNVHGTRSPEAWTALARRAEALGYDVLQVPDHLGGSLSPIAALTAAAMATSRLRVGAFVFANDFRHPLVLAREVATLDWLSGGRVEFGIGAGWNPADYRQLGIPYPRPGLRLERLEEAVPVFKRLLAGETVDHEGTHYRLARARVAPHPVQDPRPPIMIGGGGPRLLRLAAREADIVGFLPQFSRRGMPMVRQASEAETARKAALVREAAGARADAIELNMFVGDGGVIGHGPVAGSVAATAKRLATRLIATPYVLYGTLDQLSDELLERRERLGISYYSIPGHRMEAMAPLVEALTGR